jgi:hypothetical protein
VRRFEESAKRLGVRSISQKELNCVSIPRSSTVRIHACESAALSSRPGGFGFELRSAFGVSPTLEFVGRQKERTAMSVLRSVPAISAFSTLRFTLTISTMPSSVPSAPGSPRRCILGRKITDCRPIKLVAAMSEQRQEPVVQKTG